MTPKPSAQEIAAALDTLERAGMIKDDPTYRLRYECRTKDGKKTSWMPLCTRDLVCEDIVMQYKDKLSRKWYRNVRLYRCRVVEEPVEVAT